MRKFWEASLRPTQFLNLNSKCKEIQLSSPPLRLPLCSFTTPYPNVCPFSHFPHMNYHSSSHLTTWDWHPHLDHPPCTWTSPHPAPEPTLNPTWPTETPPPGHPPPHFNYQHPPTHLNYHQLHSPVITPHPHLNHQPHSPTQILYVRWNSHLNDVEKKDYNWVSM